ncbi:atherin [Triticum aestivum]|uniref:atherin n=1 Tax=Triticum aestivum TaxID=4565 RepID=UPI001D02B4E2|nr:atherin-like [Triticum aestivum]
MVCNHSVFNPTSHAIKPPVVHPSLKEIVRTTSRSPAQPHAPVCGSSRTTSRHRAVPPARPRAIASFVPQPGAGRRAAAGAARAAPRRSPSRHSPRPAGRRAAAPEPPEPRPAGPPAAARSHPSPQVAAAGAALRRRSPPFWPPCPPPLLSPHERAGVGIGLTTEKIAKYFLYIRCKRSPCCAKKCRCRLGSLAAAWSRPGRRLDSPPSPPRINSVAAARNPIAGKGVSPVTHNIQLCGLRKL